MEEWLNALLNVTADKGPLPPETWTGRGILLLAVLVAALLADLITRAVILRWVSRLLDNKKSRLGDALANARVYQRIGHLLPPLILFWSAPYLFPAESRAGHLVALLAELGLLLVITRLFIALVNVAEALYDERPASSRLPVRSLSQLSKLMLAVIFLLLALSLLFDQSPVYLLSGLGAFTAILLLVFKDTILGFVGGVQLAANDMVRRGDWIEMGKFGADGTVTDVALATVKVQNWDKTITTIPTYALISDSFKNWRGMEECGGRRIKRAIYLDVNSIRYLNDQEQRALDTDLQQALAGEDDGPDSPLTNLGLFRRYLQAYLRQHPQVRPDMTLLVRQLAPTAHGLPLEVYLFCREQRWAQYESIQADLMEHLYATLPRFYLRAYQRLGSADLSNSADDAARLP